MRWLSFERTAIAGWCGDGPVRGWETDLKLKVKTKFQSARS